MSEKDEDRREKKHRRKSKERREKRRRSRSRSHSGRNVRKYSRSPRRSYRNDDRTRRTSSRSRSPNRSWRRSSSRRRSPSRDGAEHDAARKDPKPITLKEIISANPGISMPEAVSRLNAYNSAIARGETPPSLNGSAVPQVVPLSVSAIDGNSSTKAQREVYVGNLPPGIGVSQLTEVLNTAMRQIGAVKDQNPIVNVWISPDAHYAFVEFRSVEEATFALNQLNGYQVGGYNLRLGRTKGNLGLSSEVTIQAASIIGALPVLSSSSVVSEPLSDVVMVANLPAMLDEGHIKELFTPFGELKAFNLIKSVIDQGQSAVFEFSNSRIAEAVVAGMNNLDVAGQRISVQRVPLSSAAVLLKPVKPITRKPNESNVSCIVCLSNMTTAEDLANDNSYQELLEDIFDECSKHSRVESIVIPRFSGDPNLVGKIFVSVAEDEDARRLLQAVGGRKFNGNFVEASFYSMEDFSKQNFESRDVWKVPDVASHPVSLSTTLGTVNDELD